MSAGGQGRQRRAEGKRRHQQIIEGTLRLIAREGIRAVRHRAVAKEAEVPLAATTYYFSDIGQLLRDAFTYFAQQRAGDVDALRQRLLATFMRAEAAHGRGREQLAEEVADALADHVIGQAAQPEDRAIELAFKHEARRDAGLQALSTAQESKLLNEVEALLAGAHSADPYADAQISLALIYRLEAELTFGELTGADARRVLRRHVGLQLGTSGAPG